MTLRRLIAVVAVLAALPVAGCGFGAGEESGDVTLRVTRDYGTEVLHEGVEQDTSAVSEGDTVMRVLQRDYDVKTRYGGGFVQAIDGVAGGRENGRRADWFYYVNGIEAPVGAAERRLSGGEHIWWDHHEWEAAQRVPAVVGAFPEPFRSGTEGKRFPVRLVCPGDDERSCDEVETRLEDAGVTGLSRATLEQSGGQEVLRVLVGRWSDVRRDPVVRSLERGPAASGVFARPTSTGDAIVLLDSDGRPVRTLRGPTWIVAGTDDVGVAAAAAALTDERLESHFALAIDAGRDVPLPVTGPGTGP